MTGPWAEADVVAAVRQIQERVAATFVALGHLPPMAWLFATRHPDTGAPVKHLMAVPPMGEASVRQRVSFPLLIRLAALKGGAVGVVVAARATARTAGGATQEVLTVLAEHRSMGARVWRAPIGQSETGGVEVGPWKREEGIMESRFLKLLPSV